MREDTIRVFAVSKLPWIRQQQHKLREQERETTREYLDRESHYVFGKRCNAALIWIRIAARVLDTRDSLETPLGILRKALRQDLDRDVAAQASSAWRGRGFTICFSLDLCETIDVV